MSLRAEKVASVIKRALSQPIVEIARETKAGFVTLTAVRISSDLQIAKLYISIYGKNTHPGEFLQELENRKHELKQVMAKEVHLRYLPELKFYFDDTLDQMEHIQELLDSVKKTGGSENNPEE
jgi:ribosome-binding factor A